MELPICNLIDFIQASNKPLSFNEIYLITITVFLSVLRLHAVEFVAHRDIKPENI